MHQYVINIKIVTINYISITCRYEFYESFKSNLLCFNVY